MKRSLTILSRSLLTSLMLFLPTSLLQASILSVSEKAMPIQREGKIIAQLPGFQPDFKVGDFNPNSNGFNFTNEQLTQALKKRLNNKGELDEDSDYFKNTLVWFFGTSVCQNKEDIERVDQEEQNSPNSNALEAKNCILTAPAKEWLKQNIQPMRYGLCEGIATASLYLWLWEKDDKNYANRTNFFTDPADEGSEFQKLLLKNNKRINSLNANEEELQDYITNLFILQVLTKVSRSTAEIRNNEKPSQILERLIGSMRLNPNDPYTMGIYEAQSVQKDGKSVTKDGTPMYKLTKGHSLVPFAVEEKDKGIYRVYVYDSNHPGKSPYVEFNTQSEEWRYYEPDRQEPTYTGDAEKKNLDLTRLSLRDLPLIKHKKSTNGEDNNEEEANYFDCPFCGDDSNSSTGTQPVDIFLNGQGELSITDLEGNEIDGVDKTPFKGGLGKDVPPSYHLPSIPAEKPYKITLTSTKVKDIKQKEQNDTLTIVGSDFTAGFKNIDLSQGEKLVMYVYPGKDGPKLAFQGSKATTIPTLYFALNDESTKTSYKFEVSDIKLDDGKLVQVVADTERKRLYLGDNDEIDDDYNLKMEFTIIDKDGKGKSIPPYQGYSEGEGVPVPIKSTQKEVAYFAYGQWRANYFTRDYTSRDDLPFYAAQFQPLGSANGQAFNENTVKPTGNLFRNGTGPTRN